MDSNALFLLNKIERVYFPYQIRFKKKKKQLLTGKG